MINEVAIRSRVRNALGGMGHMQKATVTHADGTTSDVMGYKYAKSVSGGWAAALPGQMIDTPDGVFFMALYPDALPDTQPDDTISIAGADPVRIVSVRDEMGAYQTYRLAV